MVLLCCGNYLFLKERYIGFFLFFFHINTINISRCLEIISSTVVFSLKETGVFLLKNTNHNFFFFLNLVLSFVCLSVEACTTTTRIAQKRGYVYYRNYDFWNWSSICICFFGWFSFHLGVGFSIFQWRLARYTLDLVETASLWSVLVYFIGQLCFRFFIVNLRK